MKQQFNMFLMTWQLFLFNNQSIKSLNFPTKGVNLIECCVMQYKNIRQREWTEWEDYKIYL